jgi:hypothetical protein
MSLRGRTLRLARINSRTHRRAPWSEMAFRRIAISLYLFVEHDLFGKPVPTFPDHAVEP